LNIKIQKSTIILLVSLLLLSIHHFFLYSGHFGFDDMEYAELSYNFINGEIDWQNHYSYRLVPLMATGLSYSIFGVNDFASALPSLLLSATILYGFFSYFKEKPYFLALAIAVYFSFQWNIFYSDKLMPDIYVSCFSFWAFLCFLRYREGVLSPGKTGAWIAVLLFLAFNSKGTIIISAPLWIYLFLVELKNKKRKTLLRSIEVMTILLGVYFGSMYFLTGDAFARFAAIDTNSYFNECSYAQMDFSKMIERWTSGFWYFLWDELLIIPMLFAVYGMGYYFIKKRELEILFYSGIIVVLLLSINFMTISISSYNPICLDPRHIMMVTPIMALACAKTIELSSLKSPIGRAVILLGCLLSLYYFIEPTKARIKVNYPAIKKDIQEIHEKENTTFMVNPAYLRLSRYYNSFRPHATLRFIDYTKINEVTQSKTDYVLLRNWYTEYLSKINEKSITKSIDKMGLKIVKEPFAKTNNQYIRLHETHIEE